MPQVIRFGPFAFALCVACLLVLVTLAAPTATAVHGPACLRFETRSTFEPRVSTVGEVGVNVGSMRLVTRRRCVEWESKRARL